MSDIVIPSFGESITEARINQWLVKNNEKVKVDQLVAIVDSDKVSYDLVAEEEGYIQILTVEGESVAIGQIVAHVLSGMEQREAKIERTKERLAIVNEIQEKFDEPILKKKESIAAPIIENDPLLTREANNISLKQVKFDDMGMNTAFTMDPHSQPMRWCCKVGNSHYIYIGESGTHYPNVSDVFFVEDGFEITSQPLETNAERSAKIETAKQRLAAIKEEIRRLDILSVSLPKEPSVDEERPLLTRRIMDSFISMRLRESEAPRHIDALTAARDFYEQQISRDYVFRPKAREKLVHLLVLVRELQQHLGANCPQELRKRSVDALLQGEHLFIKTHEKGK